ncbi:MAG: FAD-binding protein [Planctomycetales bacterium]
MSIEEPDLWNLLRPFGVIKSPSNRAGRLLLTSSEIPNEFVLGTFDRQVTVYDQQVRALNLAFALFHADRLPQPNSMAQDQWTVVIGAGVAGLTFAAASLWLGKKVVLVEKQPVECHLQRGCDIRWIHPHIYHWPRLGSEQPYAGLPLLSWVEGTASDVARQIIGQWKELKKVSEDLNRLRCHFSATHKYDPQHQSLSVHHPATNSEADGSPYRVQRVVYAVGFGVEKTDPVLPRHSYWENDSFHQLQPDHPVDTATEWLVLGMGDGGLIDLQRLCIENFRQDRIVEEFFPKRMPLVEELRRLWSERPPDLDHQLKLLVRRRMFRAVDEQLQVRARIDAQVMLLAKRPFETEFDDCRASFLNRVVVHRLHALKKFTYVAGEFWSVARRFLTSDEKLGVVYKQSEGKKAGQLVTQEFDRVIIRYGTDRSKWLRQAGYWDFAEFELQKRQDPASFGAAWSPGWWAENVDSDVANGLASGVGRQPSASLSGPVPREHVNPYCEAIAFTFVQTVARMMQSSIPSAIGSEATIRITLHRLIPVNERLCLQQLCDYAGTRQDDAQSESSKQSPGDRGSALERRTVGRVFELGSLTIGVCAQLRRPLLLRSKASPSSVPQDLIDDMNRLMERSKARRMKGSVRELLAVPLLSPDQKGTRRTLLVFYADSTAARTFTSDLIARIQAALLGFRDQIDALAQAGSTIAKVIDWEWPNIPSEQPDATQFQTLVPWNKKDYGPLWESPASGSTPEYNEDLHSFRNLAAFEIAANR